MLEASDITIIGTVIDSETELRHNSVFTRNYIKATDVKNGNIDINSVITVLQTGGIYREHITPAISEIPLLTIGEKYELSLILSDYSELYGQYYLISGGYQGVMKIEENGILVPLCDTDIFPSNQQLLRAVANTPLYSYYWNKGTLSV